MNLTYLSLILFIASYLGTSECVLCEVGEALKDANNPDVDRMCGNGCPNNYYCVQSPSVQAGGICCRTRASACTLPVASGAYCGTASVQTQKWYYDPTKAMCCPFFYNGCFGNLNNFASSQECVAKCSGTSTVQQLCPAGSSVQAGTTADTPCNMTPFMQCQAGYTCQFSNTMQRSYCCSSQSSVQLCPAGYTAAPGSTVASTCSSFTGCTPGYTCMQSPGNLQFYCCGQQTSNQLCPSGLSPAPGVTLSTPCQPGFACATAGYTCQLSPFNGFNYCCSSQNTNPNNVMCPQGGQPVMYAGTNQVVTCGNGVGCTSPYVCQSVVLAGISTGICCTSNNNAARQECPSGYVPFRSNNRMIVCNVNGIIQPGMCPQGTNCLWSPTQRTNICCTVGRRGRKLVLPTNATETTATTADVVKVTKATKSPK